MSLFEELQSAGLPVISATEDGAVSMGAMTPEQQETFTAIIEQYFLPDVYAARLRAEQARQRILAIPDWATWTEDEALAWHDENIAAPVPFANLSEANAWAEKLKVENRALVRMVLALRDRVFPDLT